MFGLCGGQTSCSILTILKGEKIKKVLFLLISRLFCSQEKSCLASVDESLSWMPSKGNGFCYHMLDFNKLHLRGAQPEA